MPTLTIHDQANGKVSAQSITQVVERGLVTTWMPVLCGYPIGRDGKPVQLPTREEALSYAQSVKESKQQELDRVEQQGGGG